MNLNEQPLIQHVLQEIASIQGDKASVYESISNLLTPIAGFKRLRVLSRSLEHGFSAQIQPSGKWLVLEASASEQGFTDEQWQLVTSVTSGTLGRLPSGCNGGLPSTDLDTISSLIIVKDREGRFLHVNQQVADLYGSTCEQMLGKTDAEFNDNPELCERFIADDRKAIDTGEPVHIPEEANTRCTDGKTTWFETVKVPLKNADGEFDRVLIVANPHFEKPVAKFSLGFQNSFLFKMIDNSPNWIAVKDRQGKFVFANRTLCDVFGKTLSEVIGRTDSELVPSQKLVDRFTKDDLEVIDTQQKKFILEEKTIDHDGNEHWVQTVKKPVIEVDGSCDQVLIVCVPIDEQKKAAAKLRENEQFLREVIDNNPSLILVKDRDGKFLLANKSVGELYGVSAEDLIGKSDADFNSNLEEIEQFREIEKSVFETGEAIKIDAEKVTDHNGDGRWFKTIKKPIESKRDASELLIVCTDITEQIEAKEKLELAKERAIQASLAKTEFLTRMSHELRTPLNAILGFNQLLQQDENLTEEQCETLGIINKSGKHLLNLISDVLEMSKVELGELELNNGRVDLAKMIEGTVDLFIARASANDCKLTYSVCPEVPKFIEGDEVKLRQVILNFVSNAVKFTHDGTVEVSVEKTASSRLRVSVIDNGPGIAEDEIDQVFALFKQTQTGKKSEEGTGLGLSISKSLVQLMDGEIGVISKEGEGSNFFFEIPYQELEAPTVAASTPAPKNQPNGKEYSVLVVDDAPVNRKFVTRLLDRLGYKTLEAENGVEAVAAHLHHRPDLILMDVKMPVMDGMEATATIRKNEGLNQLNRVPIIAVTANAFEEHKRKAAEVGCDGFVAKPFEFADLIDEISRQIEAPNSSVPAICETC